MSVTLMGEVWQLDLPQNELLVLLAFADHANDEGFCYPSLGRIAWKCGYKSTRAVRRVVRDLEAKGLLEVTGNEGGGRALPRLYLVTPERGTAKPSFAKRGTWGPQKEDIPARKEDSPARKRGVHRPSEPSVEPSLQPSVNRDAFLKNEKGVLLCPDCDGELEGSHLRYCPECDTSWYGRPA